VGEQTSSIGPAKKDKLLHMPPIPVRHPHKVALHVLISCYMLLHERNSAQTSQFEFIRNKRP
jgi:hypothetical protein